MVQDASLPCDIEVCGNEKDDDCNGLVDDGCPCAKVSETCECAVGAVEPCGESRGACRQGERRCGDEGRWGACSGGIGPVGEQCNGVDDDCDGDVDEALSRSCGSNVGECREGQQRCAAGVWGDCAGATNELDEACNGLDDDCDGDVDEGLTRPCGSSVGACRPGVSTCAMGTWGACAGETLPAAERCDGALDENCDGQVDEGCTCTEGRMMPCGVTGGVCRQGQQTCTDAGVWSSCAGDVRPGMEVCDGLDNDCNGTVDDPGTCRPPVVMCPATQSGVTGTPVMLTATASDPDGMVVSTQWTVTSRPMNSTATPTPATTPATSFTADQSGNYVLSFCATDDHGAQRCCSTTVTTAPSCTSPPPPPVSTACQTSWDGRPIVEFPAVPTGLRYELLSASNVVLATASVGHNHLRPAVRISTGGPPPGLAVPLTVRACRTADPTCCSSEAPLSINVVETCTAPIVPTTSNIVLSEYVVIGEGQCPSVDCMTMDTCQAGEAVEITNLSNCPVSLNGFHFAYRNASAANGSMRWMNFGSMDVIPPRGVYVAIRNRQYAPTCRASLGADNPGLFGLRVSQLSMLGPNLCSGWFNNSGGGMSELRIAPGSVGSTQSPNFSTAAVASVAPYLSPSPQDACNSIGFNAVNSCGTVAATNRPTTTLSPNQLGRLWHPCDALSAPVPACVRD